MHGLLDTSIVLGQFISIYLAFRLKHLIADYFLQSSWMARGKAEASNWLAPLVSHAGIHGAGTAAIAMVFAPALWWLGLVDVMVHASIDRMKSIPACGGRWQPSQPAFWWCHGVDQEAHNLTHLIFILAMLSA